MDTARRRMARAQRALIAAIFALTGVGLAQLAPLFRSLSLELGLMCAVGGILCVLAGAVLLLSVAVVGLPSPPADTPPTAEGCYCMNCMNRRARVSR